MSQNIEINIKTELGNYEAIYPLTKAQNVTDLYDVLDVKYLQLAGGNIVGKVTVNNPTEPKQVVNKQYIDDLVGNISTLLDKINGEVV